MKTKIMSSWSDGNQNVCAVLPTGAGKTVLLSNIVSENQGSAIVIAHRQELVGQISLALARDGVRHNIIAPPAVVRFCTAQHMSHLGARFYNAHSHVHVAGVDTLVRRDLEAWMNSVTLWVHDECHHITNKTKFANAINMFPNAKGLGVTATPRRADGKGLSRDTDGVLDDMVVGVSMRDLIQRGFLTEYRIFAPPNNLHLENVGVSPSTGDYNQPSLRKAVMESQIVGDVVMHYKRIAMGKRGVTFTPDVETATRIAKEYRDNGVPAEVVSGKTPDKVRVEIIERFRRGELLNLCNCDIFGEGFDLPAIEVVSMARPTKSYSLYCQQFGRALRPMEGKDHAIIIDHVGNTIVHGLPDSYVAWTLDRRAKRSKAVDDAIPTKVCPACTAVFERLHTSCPFCGYEPPVAERSGPEYVDGDLMEMTPEMLESLRKKSDVVDKHPDTLRDQLSNLEPVKKHSIVKSHVVRQETQSELREHIGWWGAYQRQRGVSDKIAYRKFYWKFGVDVLTARSLNTAEARALMEKVKNDYSTVG